MVELLFLLLPLAFYSGWRAARKSLQNKRQKQKQLSSHFVKGVNYLLNEEPDKALEVFLDYPDIDEYTAETYQLLGNMFRNRGEVDRALRIHQNLIARANLDTEKKHKAMLSLGKDFFAAGMLDRAESVFLELLNHSKSTKTLSKTSLSKTTLSRATISKASICGSLRTIYEQTQEWEKAIEAIKCSKGSNSQSSSQDNIDNNALIAHYYCELADEALSEGNLHEVDKVMAKAKAAYKKSTRLMCLQGDVAYHQKKYGNALKHYLVAVKNDSRLLKMLDAKIEHCVEETDAISSLYDSLIKCYKKNKDTNILETIISYAQKYGANDKVDKLIETELGSEKLNIESISKASDYIINQNSNVDRKQGLLLVNKSLKKYLMGLPAFHCEHCGYRLHDYLWRCPACHYWDTIDHA